MSRLGLGLCIRRCRRARPLQRGRAAHLRRARRRRPRACHLPESAPKRGSNRAPGQRKRKKSGGERAASAAAQAPHAPPRSGAPGRCRRARAAQWRPWSAAVRPHTSLAGQTMQGSTSPRCSGSAAPPPARRRGAAMPGARRVSRYAARERSRRVRDAKALTRLRQGGHADVEAGHAGCQSMHQALRHGATRRQPGAAGLEGRAALDRAFRRLLSFLEKRPALGGASRHMRKQPQRSDARSCTGAARGKRRQMRNTTSAGNCGSRSGAAELPGRGAPPPSVHVARRGRGGPRTDGGGRRASAAPSAKRRRQRKGLMPQYFLTSAVSTRMKAMPSEMPTASAARGVAAGVRGSSRRRSKRRARAAVGVSARERATGRDARRLWHCVEPAAAATRQPGVRAAGAGAPVGTPPRNRAGNAPTTVFVTDMASYRRHTRVPKRSTRSVGGTRPAQETQVVRTLVSASLQAAEQHNALRGAAAPRQTQTVREAGQCVVTC